MGRALFCPLSPPKITLDNLRCSGTFVETSEGSDFTHHHGATSPFPSGLGCLRQLGASSVGTHGVGAAAVGFLGFVGLAARQWALADPKSRSGRWAPGPPRGAEGQGGSAGAARCAVKNWYYCKVTKALRYAKIHWRVWARLTWWYSWIMISLNLKL